jgi:hypothetical protein
MGETIVQEDPGRLLSHPARIGKAGSVASDHVNPVHSMHQKEQRCQPVTLRNPRRSTTTPMSRPSAWR